MISAGQMDQQIIPLYPTYAGRSDMGSQKVTWRRLSIRWAKVHYAKGAKVLEAGETVLDQEIVVTTHYTSVITERFRLIWQGRTYEIISLNGTRREGTLTIRARRLDEGNPMAEYVEPTEPTEPTEPANNGGGDENAAATDDE